MNLVERILTPSEDAWELVSWMFVISVSVSRENPLDFYGKKVVLVPSGKLTWLAGKSTMNEDVFLIEHGDFPMS